MLRFLKRSTSNLIDNSHASEDFDETLQEACAITSGNNKNQKAPAEIYREIIKNTSWDYF
jgi:hypothetical protein